MALANAERAAESTIFTAPAKPSKPTVGQFRQFSRRLDTTSKDHKDPAVGIKLNERTNQVIKDLVGFYGMSWLSAKVGLHETTIYKLLAGYSEKTRPETMQKFKQFLAGYLK